MHLKNVRQKHYFSFILWILVHLLFLFTFGHTTEAAPGILKQINFQGKVVNLNGTNVANGSYTFVFKIYTVSTGGAAVWTETKSLTVTDGIFRTALGDTTTLPGSIDFNTDNIYLGITFNGDTEMDPRVRFTSVPYALNAEKVSGLTVTNTSGTLTVPNSRTISFADAFTTSGANALTLTTTNTTNVTLPTGGTVLTNTTAANQTVTSTQSTGTILGITDSTALTGAIKGLSITLSGSNVQDQTGLEFNLSNATGTNLNDIVGTGSTWKVSKAGALTVASCTGCGGGSQTPWTSNIDGDNFSLLDLGTNITSRAGLTMSSANNGAGASGGLTMSSGTGTTSTGTTIVATGNASAGTAGNISVDVGTSTSGNGSILIGTAARAQTITIGNSTGGTITVGASSGSDLALNDAQWSVTGAGAATLASVTAPTHTASAGLTLSSGGSSDLTLDSASGNVAIAANDGITYAAGTGSTRITINAGSTGTTANLLVKLDTSGTVITTDTSTLNNAVGVSMDTKTSGQATRVAIQGVVTAVADNTVTAGDFVGVGTTTAGRAKSLGTTYPSTAGVQVVGRAVTGAAAGSTFTMLLQGLDNSVSAGAACSTCISFATGTPDNTTGSNSLLQLQKNGVDKFVVANTGGLTIGASTSNIVKTTTGTTKTTDFSYDDDAGASAPTLTNITSSDDALSITNTAVTNTMSTSTVVTAAAAGAGAHTILRDDGKFVIVHGNSLATGSIWDGSSTSMTSMTVATGVTNPGVGSISLKRPDGKFLLIHANASQLSSVFDPWNIQAVAAGPTMCAAAIGAGTNAFIRPDGKYVILCGGASGAGVNWGVYDPTANTYTGGTSLGTAFGVGAHAIQRDDNTFLVFAGGGVSTHWIYNANNNTMSAANPITSNAPTISTGAFSIRRADGKFLVLPGAQNTSYLYDPTRTATNSGAGSMTAQTVGAGWGPTQVLADGAQAIWRQDGKYLLITGTTNVTNIIDPSKTDNTQFTAGPNLNANAAAGLHAFIRSDGNYQIIRGGATTTTDVYNTGLVMGGSGTGTQLASFETACITTTNLNSTSTLRWNKNAEGKIWFRVKTGNGSCPSDASYKDILNSGDYINPTSGDNRIQIKVFFQRDFPKFADQEWGVRRGLNQTRYRRTNKDPSLSDFQIDNSTSFHRTQFEFGNSSDPSGPLFVNLNNDRDRELAIGLEYGVGYGSTINTAANAGGITNGAFGPHTSLTSGITGFGTIVIRKPDGKYIIIAGTTAANAMVYDPTNQTIASNGTGTALPTAATGKGASALKRPDGKFFIIMGGNTTTTNIYDPVANTFTAGPAATAAVERGASLIPLPNGRILIIHGNNSTSTSIYDPYQNTMVAGPTTPAAIGHGALAIPRPDGTYLVVMGQPAAAGVCATTNTATSYFNPYTMTFTAITEVMTAAPGEGALAIQRADGMWLIIHGAGGGTTCTAANTTSIYNPYTHQIVAGPTTSAVVGAGSFAMPRPDGTWIIVHGGNIATTSIYREKSGAAAIEGVNYQGVFVAGPSVGPVNPGTALLVNAGATAFQRDDGKHVLFVGNTASSTTVAQIYDGGWVSNGTYRSEALNISDLDANSVLTWRSTASPGGISAEVRTATSKDNLQTAASREITASGGKINPGVSETWVTINFNFQRSFPSYPGTRSDVWFNNSNGYYEIRKIDKPILNEFKISKDVDLINLQQDGLSVFRINSSGDVYTSSNGSINTGGADLAEHYSSQTPLEKGEVVSIDPQNNHGVQRSKYQYQPDVLGVVSTAPGFVAGAFTPNSHPVALVGRVPVKVSTENGIIHTGDYLTAASVPGHAMKAVRAGRVLGKALENLDQTKLTECPTSDVYVPGRMCGEVMMFVNLTDYLGAPIQFAMAEWQQSHGITSSQTNAEDLSASLASAIPASADTNQEVLDFLNNLKNEREQLNNQHSSEVLADEIHAINKMISPQLITDVLTAKKIKATTIEGLTVTGPTEFKDKTLFSQLATFLDAVLFKGIVTFEQAPVFANDTAGFALIHEGADRVDVTFEKKYQETPLIHITPLLDTSSSDEHTFPEEYNYMVTNMTPEGFTLLLKQPTTTDLHFTWTALAIKEPKTFESLASPSPSPEIEEEDPAEEILSSLSDSLIPSVDSGSIPSE